MRPSAARQLIAVGSLLAAVSLAPRAAGANFREVKIGDEIRDRDLPLLDGGKAPLLGRSQASVFVFFRPNHDHSLQALTQLAVLEKEFAGKPVRFVAVTSGSYDKADVRAMVKEAGVKMPVLVDGADALYGELGVKLHPVVGIADSRHRLAEYQHFQRINLLDMMRGKIQLVLGEINVAELERIQNPEKSGNGDDRGHARTRVNLAKVMLQRGNVDLAIESARQAIVEDPTYARAHVVLAQALAASGKCDEAEKEFAVASKLDPAEASGQRVCAR